MVIIMPDAEQDIDGIKMKIGHRSKKYSYQANTNMYIYVCLHAYEENIYKAKAKLNQECTHFL